jgi:hypothetical protein
VKPLRCALLAPALLALLPALTPAQKKPAPRNVPRIIVASRLGVAPGATVRLDLRGLKLDEVTGVRCAPKGTAKVLKKAKVGVPNGQDASRVGDSHAEVELTVPADVAGNTITLVAQSRGGDSAPYTLALDRTPVLAEKEPNGGFKQAQPIKVGQVVEGAIDRSLDVDTYRFAGKAGQKLVLEVLAARHGSALDSLLTLYDARGRIVDSNDDLPDSTDSRLEVTLRAAGSYYVTVQDANDQGGPAFVYRLVVRAK